jgi:hypothetical protein
MTTPRCLNRECTVLEVTSKRRATILETAIHQGSTYHARVMPTAGPTRKWHSVSLSRRGEAEL